MVKIPSSRLVLKALRLHPLVICQLHIGRHRMAKSKFEYVRQFETEDRCLPNCWIVVRIDGRNFHKFSDVHKFEKPNDLRALELMTCAAKNVMNDYKEIVMAYGQSDEYSFVFRKKTESYNRRASKLMTNVTSLFSSNYVFHWKTYMGETDLQYPPSFDGRVVLYPSDTNLRDYLSWRQADCHINNLYNTCFWTLIQQKGITPREAQERLKGTVSGDKNELLFSEFSVNYNDLPEIYRKGTVLVRTKVPETVVLPPRCQDGSGELKTMVKYRPHVEAKNVDIIGDQFWADYSKIFTENSEGR